MGTRFQTTLHFGQHYKMVASQVDQLEHSHEEPFFWKAISHVFSVRCPLTFKRISSQHCYGKTMTTNDDLATPLCLCLLMSNFITQGMLELIESVGVFWHTSLHLAKLLKKRRTLKTIEIQTFCSPAGLLSTSMAPTTNSTSSPQTNGTAVPTTDSSLSTLDSVATDPSIPTTQGNVTHPHTGSPLDREENRSQHSRCA